MKKINKSFALINIPLFHLFLEHKIAGKDTFLTYGRSTLDKFLSDVSDILPGDKFGKL